MKTNEKESITVQTMREIRDKLSLRIMDMSFEEEKAYLKEILKTKRLKSSKKSRQIFEKIQ